MLLYTTKYVVNSSNDEIPTFVDSTCRCQEKINFVEEAIH